MSDTTKAEVDPFAEANALRARASELKEMAAAFTRDAHTIEYLALRGATRVCSAVDPDRHGSVVSLLAPEDGVIEVEWDHDIKRRFYAYHVVRPLVAEPSAFEGPLIDGGTD